MSGAPGVSNLVVIGFAEYEGVLERLADERRVIVMLELLGREVRVFVQQLASAPPEAVFGSGAVDLGADRATRSAVACLDLP
jgi:hypothetical protein